MTIADTVDAIFREKQKDAWISLPAIVKVVDRQRLRVDVQIKAFFGSEIPALVVDLPVIIIRGGNNFILPAIKVNDVVAVVASTLEVSQLLDDSQVKDLVVEGSFRLRSGFVLPGVLLETEVGQLIGTKKKELPIDGMVVVSDKDIHIEAPDVRLVSDEGVGVDIDSSAGPGIDLTTTGPATLTASIFNMLQTALQNVKHRTADPAIGDLSDGEVNTGLVGGTGKIYFKKGTTIYVFNHSATIT